MKIKPSKTRVTRSVLKTVQNTLCKRRGMLRVTAKCVTKALSSYGKNIPMITESLSAKYPT